MRKKLSSKKTNSNKKTQTQKKGINFKRLFVFISIAFVTFFFVYFFGMVQVASDTGISQEERNAETQISVLQNTLKASDLTGDFNQNDNRAEFNGKNILVPDAPKENKTAEAKNNSKVLGETTTKNEPKDYKRIEVDLTNQRLYAFEGDDKIHDFLISSGKWGKTPTGTFRIWGKFRYTKMSGGSKENRTYYYLPNVPFVMFFSGEGIPASRGFGIHGTYWHDNFGTPMSHGCVNMKTEEAEIIYNWSDPNTGDKKSIRADKDNAGTQVIIYGVAPKQ